MTLAEIEAAVRYIIKETSTETGALNPADNVRLDVFINMACNQVMMDLIHFIKDWALTKEDISLAIGTSAYTLTANPLHYFGILKNVTGEAPSPIREYKIFEIPDVSVVGESADDPQGYYFTGPKTINFFPKPASARTNYASVYFIPQEPATMVAGGPTYLPAVSHHLVAIRAAINMMVINDQEMTKLERLYSEFRAMVIQTLGTKQQGQPRFLFPDFKDLSARGGDSRDRAFYDLYGIFDRR